MGNALKGIDDWHLCITVVVIVTACFSYFCSLPGQRIDKGINAYRSSDMDHLSFMEDASFGTHNSSLTLLRLLRQHGLTVVTSESLTGGFIAKSLVDVPTFGGHIYGGFVVYNSDAKREFLGVQTPNVYNYKTAREMAEGALQRSRAMMAISVTGQAGPTNPGDEDSIGVVDCGVYLRTGAHPPFYGLTTRLNVTRLLYTIDAVDYCEGENMDPVALHPLQLMECSQFTGNNFHLHQTRLESLLPYKSIQYANRKLWAWKASQRADDGNCVPTYGMQSNCAALLISSEVRDIIRLVTTSLALDFAAKVLQDAIDNLHLNPPMLLSVLPVRDRDVDPLHLACGNPTSLILKYLNLSQEFHSQLRYPKFSAPDDECTM